MSITFFKSLAALTLGAAVFAQPALAGKPLKVGVTAGPHAQIFEVVRQEAAKQGLQVEIIEFSDYVQPNAAISRARLACSSCSNGSSSAPSSSSTRTKFSGAASCSTRRRLRRASLSLPRRCCAITSRTEVGRASSREREVQYVWI